MLIQMKNQKAIACFNFFFTQFHIAEQQILCLKNEPFEENEQQYYATSDHQILPLNQTPKKDAGATEEIINPQQDLSLMKVFKFLEVEQVNEQYNTNMIAMLLQALHKLQSYRTQKHQKIKENKAKLLISISYKENYNFLKNLQQILVPQDIDNFNEQNYNFDEEKQKQFIISNTLMETELAQYKQKYFDDQNNQEQLMIYQPPLNAIFFEQKKLERQQKRLKRKAIKQDAKSENLS